MTPSELCEIAEIHQLKARYFRFVDTKQWQELRGLFVDDAVYEGSSVFPSGPDDFVAKTQARLQSAISAHQGHMPEIRLLGPGRARGIWAMYDWIEFAAVATEGPFAGWYGFTGYGYYQEEYRKENGVWKISFLRLTRLRLDPIQGESRRQDLPSGLLFAAANNWLEPERAT